MNLSTFLTSHFLRTLSLSIFLFFLTNSITSTPTQPQFPLLPQVLLRPAIPADTPSIATVIISAFGSLPNWNYLYPFRHLHPAEHHRCVCRGVTQAFAHESTFLEVIEAPINDGDDVDVVAIAIWTREYAASFHALSSKLSTERHLDPEIIRV